MKYRFAVPLLLAIAVAMVWIFPYLPMTDAPEHMLIAKILSVYGHSNLGYEEFYTAKLPWNPYSLYFLAVYALSALVSIETATRAFLSATFILTIAAYWYWLDTLAPQRKAQTVPAVLLLFGLFFFIGMLNFLISIPLMFFAMTLAWRLGSEPGPQLRLQVLLALTLLVIYLSHPVTFALTVAVLGAQWLLFLKKRLPALVLTSAPSLLIFGFYFVFRAAGEVPSYGVAWYPFLTRVETLLLPFGAFRDPKGNAFVLSGEITYFWGAVAVIVAAGAVSRRARQRGGVMLAFAALFIAAALLCPSTIVGGQPGAMRITYPVSFVVLAALPADWHDRPRLRWLMCCICIAAFCALGYRFALFQTEMQELREVVSAIPPRQVIQPVITDSHASGLHTYPFLHAAAWYCFYQGGISAYSFSESPYFPVRQRQYFVKNPPGEWSMDDFQYERHQAGTQYFLVRTTREDIVQDIERHVPLASQSGKWKVFGPNPPSTGHALN